MIIKIELPDIKAVSRNDTTGHYFRYQKQLIKAEKWMIAYGKRFEYHFTRPVDVLIKAYYDTKGRGKCADTPNIDDKIFTDILNHWKPKKAGPAIERAVWFIEDDGPKYLRYVFKQAIASDHYKVIIIIREIEEGEKE